MATFIAYTNVMKRPVPQHTETIILPPYLRHRFSGWRRCLDEAYDIISGCRHPDRIWLTFTGGVPPRLASNVDGTIDRLSAGFPPGTSRFEEMMDVLKPVFINP